MNVQVISSKYPPEYSGSGHRAHSTYLRLAQKFGVKWDVICSSVESKKRSDYSLDGVQVSRVVSPLFRSIDQNIGRGQIRRLTNAGVFHAEARAVTRLLSRRSFDLIHVFGYSPATIAAINWSRQNSIPLILEIVNNVKSPYQYLPGTRKFRSYDLTRQSVIVAISEHISDLCKSVGLDQNVWTRPNPVDTTRFSPASRDHRAKMILSTFGFEVTDKIVVYVAKFMKQKNHEFLVEVLKHLPSEYKLVLAGPTVTTGEIDPGMRSEQLPQLLSMIDQAGLGDRVRVIPEFVDTAEYLSGADVFCFPAENEAMGTPILESISAGVPVVANRDEPSFQEWIEEGVNGFLRPLRAKDWAEAVLKSASFDNQKKCNMSEQIRNSVSTGLIDEQYMKLLRAVALAAPDQQLDVSDVLSR